jgi:hypothetical protein
MPKKHGLMVHPGVLSLAHFALAALVLCMFGCGGAASNGTKVTLPPTVASVSVQPSSALIADGQTQQFNATARDQNGNVMSGVTFTWNSSKAGVATVDSSGSATSVSQGNTTITAVADEVTGSATLTVNPSSGNEIPTSFYGFTINKACSISNTNATGQGCGNPEPHSFPGFPFTWARSLGTDRIKWTNVVQCDPTGSVCPMPGSGCSKNGAGANGNPCPSDQLVAGCQPSASQPADPNNCAYVWSVFDFWTKLYNERAVDWMYSAYYTPDYLSVRGSRCTANGKADFGADPTCVGPADICGGVDNFMWGCDPPFDIDSAPGKGDAKGSDQNYKWFVTAFMTHMQQNSEHITYWEIWNEPNICQEWNHSDQPQVPCPQNNPGGGPSTGTVAQLVRMAQDARSIIPTFDASVKITTPPVTSVSGLMNYLNMILEQGGSQFDIIGFHAYFNTTTGCPSACPVPEMFQSEWSTLVSVVTAAGQQAKPVMNTEFSWGAMSNTTIPDMRKAFAARTYLLQESVYPTLTRVDWYGEDFQTDPTVSTNNPPFPNGGTGEFWASGDTNVADQCLILDPVQGGFDCPGGLAMNQISKLTIGATFNGACSCSASPNGGGCSASPPTGIFQCSITKTGGYKGLFVWDSTATAFPCANAACGTTKFTIPAGYTSDWQDLDGTVTSLGGATTLTIGAKPVLIETLN